MGCEKCRFDPALFSKHAGNRWVSVTITPIGDLKDSVLLGVADDISSNKEQEEAFKQGEMLSRVLFWKTGMKRGSTPGAHRSANPARTGGSVVPRATENRQIQLKFMFIINSVSFGTSA